MFQSSRRDSNACNLTSFLPSSSTRLSHIGLPQAQAAVVLHELHVQMLSLTFGKKLLAIIMITSKVPTPPIQAETELPLLTN